MTKKKKNRERERRLLAQLPQEKKAAPIIIDSDIPITEYAEYIWSPSNEELRFGDPSGRRWHSSGVNGHKSQR